MHLVLMSPQGETGLWQALQLGEGQRPSQSLIVHLTPDLTGKVATAPFFQEQSPVDF